MHRINKWEVCLLIALVASVAFVYMGYRNPDIVQSTKQKRFGATYMTMNNPFYVIINNQIKQEVESKGDILITRDPGLDVKKQNQQIYELIDQKVDAIFINPIDYTKIEPALKAAKKAKIPIIVIDAPVHSTSLVTTTVVSDNYGAGVACAKDMMQRKKSANIILLEHSSAKSARDRIDCFLDTIRGNAAYRILYRQQCEGQLERTMPIMEHILQINKDPIDVIMALNDPSALGALAALEEQGKDLDVLQYSVDGSPEVKTLIKNQPGQMVTAGQSPITMGDIAIQKGYEILSHKPVEKKILVPVTLIKKENIDNFDTSRWQ